MESNDTKQSQGQVSTPGESPKDEKQTTFTDAGTCLATKYKVEPRIGPAKENLHSIHFHPPATM